MTNTKSNNRQPHTREEETTWIMNIAGINLSVKVDDPVLGREACRLYSPFEVKGKSVFDIAIHVQPDMAGREPRPIKTLYDGSLFWIDSYNFSGKMDVSRRFAAFSVAPGWEGLDAVLRVIVAILLATHGGLLLHASSVSLGGKAFVFPARPEGGKSTIVRLLQGGEVIGDELVAVRRIHEDVTVYGTPFWNAGPEGAPPPVQAPAKAICLLTKADSASATMLEPVKMAAKMLPHIYYDPENSETNIRTLNALAGIADIVPGYELQFNLDQEQLRRCLSEIGQKIYSA